MSCVVTVDLGSGAEDITSKLFGRNPITRDRAIHAKDDPFKPVIGTARFAIVRDITLINRFLTATNPVAVVITKDGSAYFKGLIRNTHKVQIGRMRAEAFEVECVDAWIRLDKKCTLSATWSGYTISNPTTKTTSILHQLFYQAGFADAELSLAAVSVTRDRAVFDANQKKSYRDIIEGILREIGCSAYVDPSGIVRIYDLGPTSVTATATLTSGASGNIAEGYEITRQEAKAEAVDVSYWPHLSLAAKTVFEDTTGGTGPGSCSIPLTTGQYYPEGADATHDVLGEFKLPDYEIVAVDSPAIDWSKTGDVTKQVETVSGLGMKMRFYSATGGTLTKLRITGTAIVKGDIYKVIRENVADTEKREDVKCEWIYTQADAERLAIILANWNANSAYLYTISGCTLISLNPGDYVHLDESTIMGISQTLRIVSVSDGGDPKSVSLQCEGVTTYTYATLPTASTSGLPAPVSSQIGSTGANGYRTAIRRVYQWSAVTPSIRPTGHAKYTWATGAWSDGVPAESLGSWAAAPAAAVTGQTLWACELVASDNLATGDTEAAWASQSIFAIGGAGTNGVHAEYIFGRFPSSPTRPTGENPIDNIYWFDTPPSGTDYIWVSLATKTAEGSLVGVWSDPQKLSGDIGPIGAAGGTTSWLGSFSVPPAPSAPNVAYYLTQDYGYPIQKRGSYVYSEIGAQTYFGSANFGSANFSDGAWYTMAVDSPYVVAQYSIDNANWHTDPLTTDQYMRLSTDGGTTWSAGVLIKGETGATGDNAGRYLGSLTSDPAISVYEEDFYYRNNTTPKKIRRYRTGTWSDVPTSDPQYSQYVGAALSDLVTGALSSGDDGFTFVDYLAANSAFIGSLTANTAFIDNLFVKNIEAGVGTFGPLSVTYSAAPALSTASYATLAAWLTANFPGVTQGSIAIDAVYNSTRIVAILRWSTFIIFYDESGDLIASSTGSDFPYPIDIAKAYNDLIMTGDLVPLSLGSSLGIAGGQEFSHAEILYINSISIESGLIVSSKTPDYAGISMSEGLGSRVSTTTSKVFRLLKPIQCVVTPNSNNGALATLSVLASISNYVHSWVEVTSANWATKKSVALNPAIYKLESSNTQTVNVLVLGVFGSTSVQSGIDPNLMEIL